MLVVIIMLLLLCRTWPHLFVPRQLLLLPFSASDVTNKLLDIALGPQAPPVAQRTTSLLVCYVLVNGVEIESNHTSSCFFQRRPTRRPLLWTR